MKAYTGIVIHSIRDPAARSALKTLDRWARDADAALSPNTTALAGSPTAAATDLSYVTVASETGLSAERVLTPAGGITLADGGAGTTVTLSGAAFVRHNGAVALTANWDAGSFDIRCQDLWLDGDGASPTGTTDFNYGAGATVEVLNIDGQSVAGNVINLREGTTTSITFVPTATPSITLARGNASVLASAGSLTLGSTTTIELVDPTNVTGALGVSSTLDVTGNSTLRGTTLTLGNGAAADVNMVFNGSAFDGTLTWDESADGFRMDHFLAIGAVPGTSNRRSQVSWTTNVNAPIGLYFNVTATTGVTGTVRGVQGFVQAGTGGSGVPYLGIEANAAFNLTTGAPTGINAFAGIVAIDALGANMTAGQRVSVGDFYLRPRWGETQSVGYAAVLRAVLDPTVAWGDAGGVSTITDFHGLDVDLDSTSYGANARITNAYGIRIRALDSAASAVFGTTAYDAILCDATGTGYGASKGNIRMAGAGFNTGHLQLELGHVWIDASNDAIMFRGNAAPASATDGVGIKGTTQAAGASVGTLTNGPWATSPKNPDAWPIIMVNGTLMVVPAWNLA